MTAPLVLTVKQAAEQLAVSPPHLYRLIRRGEFPAARIGGRVVVPVVAMNEWLAARTKGAA